MNGNANATAPRPEKEAIKGEILALKMHVSSAVETEIDAFRADMIKWVLPAFALHFVATAGLIVMYMKAIGVFGK